MPLAPQMRVAHCEYDVHDWPRASQGVHTPAWQKLPFTQSMSAVQLVLQSILFALQEYPAQPVFEPLPVQAAAPEALPLQVFRW